MFVAAIMIIMLPLDVHVTDSIQYLYNCAIPNLA